MVTRNIKFRAWDKEGKKYFMECCWLSFCPNGIRFMWTDNETDNMMVTELKDYELLQYIGLHDKNHKEIYEGDIFKQQWEGKEIIGEIVYGDMARFWLKPYEYCYIGEIRLTGEVIGNIFENSRLLTKGVSND
jgi:uncharacterized phage protein (TIGR01671 family)